MPPSTRTTPARCAANDVCAARRVTVVRSGARSGVVMTRASILEVAVRDASASRSACSRQRRRRRRASTRLEVARHLRSPRRRNLHAKLTIVTSLALVATGSLLVAAFEWTNPQTFGKLDGPATVLASLLAGVMPRSGGFSTVSVGQMHEGTWLLDDALMFVGGGSASTAGGIKVTALTSMLLAILAEARGDRDVEAFGRRIPREALQVAIAVSLVSATIVLVACLVLLAITDLRLDTVLFEVVSAFATCGLSTGVTSRLPDAGKYVLTVLMFIGRVGTMTLAAALALRNCRRVIRLPEERPIIG